MTFSLFTHSSSWADDRFIVHFISYVKACLISTACRHRARSGPQPVLGPDHRQSQLHQQAVECGQVHPVPDGQGQVCWWVLRGAHCANAAPDGQSRVYREPVFKGRGVGYVEVCVVSISAALNERRRACWWVGDAGAGLLCHGHCSLAAPLFCCCFSSGPGLGLLRYGSAAFEKAACCLFDNS